jgi:hypothetical protein
MIHGEHLDNVYETSDLNFQANPFKIDRDITIFIFSQIKV